MKHKFLTTVPLQTKKAGTILAREILEIGPGKRSSVVALEGDLGGGKTTFLQGFARGLGIRQRVLSPTFVIMKKFNIKNRSTAFSRFYHIDCYRLQKQKELLGLGFKEIISNPKNIVAIEWADRVQKIIPKNAIWIKFEFVGKNIRKIMLK